VIGSPESRFATKEEREKQTLIALCHNITP
jgi:hypothetical protein